MRNDNESNRKNEEEGLLKKSSKAKSLLMIFVNGTCGVLDNTKQVLQMLERIINSILRCVMIIGRSSPKHAALVMIWFLAITALTIIALHCIGVFAEMQRNSSYEASVQASLKEVNQESAARVSEK